MISRKHLPALGIVIGLSVFVVATTRYPGGTLSAAHTIGYSWSQNYVSSLFAPTALDGEPNGARYFAIAAVFFISASLGVVYNAISAKATSRAHRKTIQIAGIGSAVYGFFVATPMHDLMVNISLVFNVVALIATTHMLYIERRWQLFTGGAFCVTLLFVTAAMYYANALYGVLPVIQKAGLLSNILWLLFLYYAQAERQVEAASMPATELAR